MSPFLESDEKAAFDLLVRMTSQHDFWTAEKPEKIGYQRFGVQLREEDFVQDGHSVLGFFVRARSATREANTGFSVVKNDEKEFEIELDVWPFKQDQIAAAIFPGKYISIKGEYEEKLEDEAECSRKFQRYYCLPKGIASDNLECSYDSGTLKFWFEKRAMEESGEGRLVHIATGPLKNKVATPEVDKDSPTTPEGIKEAPTSTEEIDSTATEDPKEANGVKSDTSAAAEETESSEEVSEGQYGNVRVV